MGAAGTGAGGGGGVGLRCGERAGGGAEGDGRGAAGRTRRRNGIRGCATEHERAWSTRRHGGGMVATSNLLLTGSLPPVLPTRA